MAVKARATRVVVVVVVLAAVVAAFFAGRATSSNPPPKASSIIVRTQREVATPWTVTGVLSKKVVVRSRVAGTCWTGSIAVDTANAWRCVSGNEIHDPCFVAQASAAAREVACLSSPWSEAVLMHLTKPLSISNGNALSNPLTFTWALQLANGDRCVMGTGANSQVAGVDLDYYCTSGALAGSLNTRLEPWAVEYYVKGADVLRQVDVATAWGG